MKQKKIIGITGGIGSGKSTVAKIIAGMGFPVYNSDNKAKELVHTNTALKTQIIELLGSEAYDAQEQYNRAWVAEQVFNQPSKLQHLNALIHPVVKEDYENWLQTQTTALIFKETALLFELDLDQYCDLSLLVTADQSIRIKRVMDRDQKTYREVEAIIAQQMPESEKINRADFIIYNNSNLEELKLATQEFISTILPPL